MKPSRVLGTVAICCMTFCASGPTANCHNVVDRHVSSEEEGHKPTVHDGDDELAEAFESVKENYFKELSCCKHEGSTLRRLWKALIDFIFEKILNGNASYPVSKFLIPSLLVSALAYIIIAGIVTVVVKCEKCHTHNNGICDEYSTHCKGFNHCETKKRWKRNCRVLIFAAWAYLYVSSTLALLPLVLIDRH